jgi:hypothetical protein
MTHVHQTQSFSPSPGADRGDPADDRGRGSLVLCLRRSGLGPAGVPVLDIASGIALVAVGLLASVLGGLIGTGGCCRLGRSSARR